MRPVVGVHDPQHAQPLKPVRRERGHHAVHVEVVAAAVTDDDHCPVAAQQPGQRVGFARWEARLDSAECGAQVLPVGGVGERAVEVVDRVGGTVSSC